MQQLELFDQVTVTWPEVFDWVRQVAGIEPDSQRGRAYVHAWRVPEKIAAAKASGAWPPQESGQVVKERRPAPRSAPAW